jgi:hypothetical protein
MGITRSLSLSKILRGAKDPRGTIQYFKYNVIHRALAGLFGRNDLGVDQVFYGTRMTIDRKIIKESTRMVPIHSLDFDLILDRKEVTSANQAVAPHTVYVDALGPLHPDLRAFRTELGFSQKFWFERIRGLLHHVTDVDGIQPVVAGHPRGIGVSMFELYAPYEVVFHKTADLIRNAKLVVAEVSTSIGLVAWYKKPLALIWLPGLPAWSQRQIATFQEALGCEVWDVTADPSTWAPPEVNEEKYDEYIRNHVKLPGTPMKKFWDVVVETLDTESNPKSVREELRVR